MALLCYNRGCGQRFDPETNADGKEDPGPEPPRRSPARSRPPAAPGASTCLPRLGLAAAVSGASHPSPGTPCTSSAPGLTWPGLRFVTALIPGRGGPGKWAVDRSRIGLLVAFWVLVRSVSSLVQPTSPIYLPSKELCLVAEMTLTHLSHSSNVFGIVLAGACSFKPRRPAWNEPQWCSKSQCALIKNVQWKQSTYPGWTQRYESRHWVG